MKLITPDVEIVPGQRGRPPAEQIVEGLPLQGSAIVRLVNETEQENAYTVRLKCEDPFWQERWYTIKSLPPGRGEENVGAMPDQNGPQDRWVRVSVPRSGTRDLWIRFDLPLRPDSRSGKYHYVIEVETAVSVQAAGRRKDRITKIPAVAIVRPFYSWNVEIAPENRIVGLRRRSADFEIVVTNEGNDWLYCDLQVPRPKDMLLESPTLRVAVPPPMPGEMLTREADTTEDRPGTQRTVPLRAITRLKDIRGDRKPQKIDLTARRVDAPSVAPSPESPFYVGPGNVIANPVMNDNKILQGERALVYQPPIPAKFTDLFTRGATSLKSLAMTVVSFLFLATLIRVFWENTKLRIVGVETSQGTLRPVDPATRSTKDTIHATGPGVIGAKITIVRENKDEVEIPSGPKIWNPLKQRAEIPVPPGIFNLGEKLTVKIQRTWGPFALPWILPHSPEHTIMFGDPIPAKATDPGVNGLVIRKDRDQNYPGGILEIDAVKGLGDANHKGKVLFEGSDVDARIISWSDTAIKVHIPKTLTPNQPCAVQVNRFDINGEMTATPIPNPAMIFGRPGVEEALKPLTLGAGGPKPTEKQKQKAVEVATGAGKNSVEGLNLNALLELHSDNLDKAHMDRAYQMIMAAIQKNREDYTPHLALSIYYDLKANMDRDAAKLSGANIETAGAEDLQKEAEVLENIIKNSQQSTVKAHATYLLLQLYVSLDTGRTHSALHKADVEKLHGLLKDTEWYGEPTDPEGRSAEYLWTEYRKTFQEEFRDGKM